MTHTKDNCKASDLIIADACGLACANCGACKCGKCNEPKTVASPLVCRKTTIITAIAHENKPEPNKIYALTGKTGDKCISNGNTWAESEIKQADK
jgi:hypothetical protein